MNMGKQPTDPRRADRSIRDAADMAADAVTYRRLMAERAARARRAAKIDKIIGETIASFIAISLAAWALMVGLSGVGVSASYWTSVYLVVAVRIAFAIRVKLDD